MSHWDSDLLNRKEDAQHIYDVALKIHDDGVVTGRTGVVMAIDAPWGEGKSYLIEGLCKDIKEKGHPVIHFNSWENDFSNDPIVSFLSEMSEGLRNEFPCHKAIIDKVTDASLKVAKKVGVTIMAGLVKKTVGLSVDELTSAWTDNPPKGGDSFSVDINKDIFNSHIEKKDALEKFKARMSELVQAIQKQEHQKRLPIFVVIDELDRCRPDFSIALLEGVKHLFSLDGVIFLIAANKAELSNSIKVLYGANFDSTMYLKRFFDIDYQLITPSMSAIWRSELNRYKINESTLFIPFRGSMDQLIDGMSVYLKLSIRDIKQLAFKLYLIYDAVKENNGNIHILYLLILLIIDFKDNRIDHDKSIEDQLGRIEVRCEEVYIDNVNFKNYSVHTAYAAYKTTENHHYPRNRKIHSQEDAIKMEIYENTKNDVLAKYITALYGLGKITS
ncbi:KAP family P-loop NTPase fold protein [Chromobacterium haemolyticum]|uniref:KAP family P-loop NTPase fold protein n=1 Tax=Chromobacterium haemolyticum TaxID=394935 RepID=UPI001315BB3E|nr:P-loop NTPase fold protein [Chromobacterium haemolyticum]BBH13352.1 hypothetical protein CH06BL_26000 [Chromobacterium haemolyticum]